MAAFTTLLFAVRGFAAPPDPAAYPQHANIFRCPWAQFDCDPSRLIPLCIPFTAVRNCRKDCPNGADELCGRGYVLCDTAISSSQCGQCVPVNEQNQRCLDRKWYHICGRPDAVHCAKTNNCVLRQWLEDGKDDCGDGSDEDPCGSGIINCGGSEVTESIVSTTEKPKRSTTTEAMPSVCELGRFRCTSGECIPGDLVLNNEKDCKDNSDEDFCSKYGENCLIETRPCSYQPDIATFGCGCPRSHTRTENGTCIPHEKAK